MNQTSRERDMKLTEAERRTWRAAMNQYAETGRITVRGTAERYGNEKCYGDASSRLRLLTEVGLFRDRPERTEASMASVPGMAVGSDGTVYREVEIPE